MTELDGAQDQDPRVFLAAERTLLAWIRTNLALMGLGFLIARFQVLSEGVVSNLIGIGLIIVAVIFCVAAMAGYLTTVRHLRQGTYVGRASRMAMALAACIVLLGSLMALYLAFES